jgi:hypothetical protein
VLVAVVIGFTVVVMPLRLLHIRGGGRCLQVLGCWGFQVLLRAVIVGWLAELGRHDCVNVVWGREAVCQACVQKEQAKSKKLLDTSCSPKTGADMNFFIHLRQQKAS